jgi:hypothetical protein
MEKRKSDQPTSQAPGDAGDEVNKAAPVSGAASSDVAAKIESPASAPPQVTSANSDATGAAPTAQPEDMQADDGAQRADVGSVEPALSEPSAAEPAMREFAIARLDDVRPGAAEETVSDAGAASPAWEKARRLAPLAAIIAFAAAVGAVAGSLTTAGFGRMWVDETSAQTTDARRLREAVARINTDLGTLKAAVDSSGRSTSSQVAKLSDRFDRFERAQAEPAAKLAKLSEALDRIERRAPPATAAHDVTGSIAAVAPSPQLASPEPTRPAGPPVLDGWMVRGVFNGAALIQSRVGGVLEVEPGDTLPGLGRIETIKRKDGRWVVVTSRGLIVAR